MNRNAVAAAGLGIDRGRIEAAVQERLNRATAESISAEDGVLDQSSVPYHFVFRTSSAFPNKIRASAKFWSVQFRIKRPMPEMRIVRNKKGPFVSRSQRHQLWLASLTGFFLTDSAR